MFNISGGCEGVETSMEGLHMKRRKSQFVSFVVRRAGTTPIPLGLFRFLCSITV